jgi:hypothetical protein
MHPSQHKMGNVRRKIPKLPLPLWFLLPIPLVVAERGAVGIASSHVLLLRPLHPTRNMFHSSEVKGAARLESILLACLRFRHPPPLYSMAMTAIQAKALGVNV